MVEGNMVAYAAYYMLPVAPSLDCHARVRMILAKHKLMHTRDTCRSRPLSLLSSARTPGSLLQHLLTVLRVASNVAGLLFKTNRFLGLRFFWGAATSLRQTLSNTHM